MVSWWNWPRGCQCRVFCFWLCTDRKSSQPFSTQQCWLWARSCWGWFGGPAGQGLCLWEPRLFADSCSLSSLGFPKSLASLSHTSCGAGIPSVPSSCWQLEGFLADGGSRCQQLLLMAA